MANFKSTASKGAKNLLDKFSPRKKHKISDEEDKENYTSECEVNILKGAKKDHNYDGDIFLPTHHTSSFMASAPEAPTAALDMFFMQFSLEDNESFLATLSPQPTEDMIFEKKESPPEPPILESELNGVDVHQSAINDEL
ncbi:hypothetical protein C0995_011541 [Termitomyces sp. Mi166|nr:hypothetical protein C0995_011541 [Termitomyces sp. Mi166\